MFKICSKCKISKDLTKFNKHIGGKYGVRGKCSECFFLYQKEWAKNHPESVKSAQRKHRKKYSEKRNATRRKYYYNNLEKSKEQSKKWHKNNPEKVKNSQLKKLYGLTLKKYNEMFIKSSGVCNICKQSETMVDKRTGKIFALNVDHDHKTGKVRGLLCNRCNKVLGLFKDSKELFLSAIDFLKE